MSVDISWILAVATTLLGGVGGVLIQVWRDERARKLEVERERRDTQVDRALEILEVGRALNERMGRLGIALRESDDAHQLVDSDVFDEYKEAVYRYAKVLSGIRLRFSNSEVLESVASVNECQRRITKHVGRTVFMISEGRRELAQSEGIAEIVNEHERLLDLFEEKARKNLIDRLGSQKSFTRNSRKLEDGR